MVHIPIEPIILLYVTCVPICSCKLKYAGYVLFVGFFCVHLFVCSFVHLFVVNQRGSIMLMRPIILSALRLAPLLTGDSQQDTTTNCKLKDPPRCRRLTNLNLLLHLCITIIPMASLISILTRFFIVLLSIPLLTGLLTHTPATPTVAATHPSNMCPVATKLTQWKHLT